MGHPVEHLFCVLYIPCCLIPKLVFKLLLEPRLQMRKLRLGEVQQYIQGTQLSVAQAVL